MIRKIFFFKKILRLCLADFSQKFPNFKGKSRIIRILDSFLSSGSEPVIKTINSVTYQFDTRDIIDFRGFYFGVNEKSVLAYLAKSIGSNQSVIWDVGANVGSVCLPLLSMCPNLIVHAFEPSPPVFSRLNVNINLNSNISERIYLENIALSDSSGVIDFFVSNELENSGVGSLGKMHNTSNVPIQVNCCTGDELIMQKKISIPSFIKIDVEGFEYEVLKGLMSFLKTSNATQIVFEHEPYRLEERKLEKTSVIRLLKDLGFTLYAIDDDGLRSFSEAMLDAHHDFLACK